MRNNSKAGVELRLKKERQVLLIINKPEICRKMGNAIREKFGFEAEISDKGGKALEMIEKSPWQYDVAVIYAEPEEKRHSLEVLKKIKKNYPEIEVIYIIKSKKRDTTEAWEEGAFNCFITPINYDGVAYAIRFAREQAQFRRERKMLEKLQQLSVKINSATELQEIQNLACQAAVEIFSADHSGLVLFEKDLSKGKVIAEYPRMENFKGTEVKVKGIQVEERLVYNQEIINVPDVGNCGELGVAQTILLNQNIRSLVIVPVVLNGRVIASISLDMMEKNRVFYWDEIELCKRLANQVAIAIGKAKHVKELSVLNKISHFISSTPPLDFDVKKILTKIRENAGILLDVKNFYIALYDEEKEEYSFPYHDDEKDNPKLVPKEKMRKGLTDYVRQIRMPVLVDKYMNQKLVSEGKIEIVGEPSSIWLGVPLVAKGKVLGVMAVQNYENENAYDEHDLKVLETIASQTAIAIDNCRLLEHSRKKLAETEALYETTQEIVGESMNIKSVLDKILKMAVELSNADSGQIFFRDTATDELKLVLAQKLDILKGIKLRAGEGMASEVVKAGKPKFTNDFYNSPYKAEIFNHPDYQNLFKALAQVPLKWKGEVIGILAISSNNFFTDESMRLLERFAGPAAIAIAIAREISFRQTLLNNSPDAIIAIDKKGTVKEFNKASEVILGYTKDEASKTPVADLWESLEEARRIKRLMYGSENGTVRRVEAFSKAKTGERIPILFSGSLLYSEEYGEEKEEIGSIGHVEDQRLVSLKGRAKSLFIAIEEINRTEELPKLLKVILHRAIKLIEADSGYIMLKKGDYFEVVESHNFKQNLVEKINIKIDNGIIGPILKSPAPKTFKLTSSHISDIPVSKNGKSALVIPLSIEDDIIGIIYLESCINDFFREENELLRILSSEAAVAINRVQLKEESEELQLLKEIGDEIRKKGEFSEYKEIIVKATQLLLKAEISTMFLYDKSKRYLFREAWYPKIKKFDPINEVYTDKDGMRGITGKILNCKEDDYMIFSDVESILKDALPASIEKYKYLPSWGKDTDISSLSPIKHYLAVPIFGEKGKVFGALRVMNKISKEYTEKNPMLDNNGFREPEDVKLLKTIASLLSQALASERKANKLRMLHDITDEISEKVNIKSIGDCLVQAIVKDFDYSACNMRLVRGDYLELISASGFRSNKIRDMILYKDEGLVGRAVEAKDVVVAHDIFSDNEKLNGGYLHKKFAKEENFRSACCVPIKGREDEVIGVIVIYMRQASYYFEDYEINDNFLPIAATCSIAMRKVQAVDHLQKLVDLLGLVHLANSKNEILDACIDEMLAIFDAYSAMIYEAKKSPDMRQDSLEKQEFEPIYMKNIDPEVKISNKLLQKIKKNIPRTFNANEFPNEWKSLKEQYSQCIVFTLDFQEETLGIVVMFTKMGIPFTLHEIDRCNLASAISRQLAIAFKNIEITDEIERIRIAQPAIISTQYVSGIIHELASSANKGKGAITYIRGTPEYKKIRSQTWKVEMSKIESAFDDIGSFTTRALEIKDIARMKFIRTLEYRSINQAIRDVIHDCSHEARKKLARINWDYNKAHDQKHTYFDEILIKQAIRNLISNSIKWISDSGGGKITITSGEKEDFIFVRVEDNGQGIEPGIEKLIFDPFFTTSSMGYGLGLFFVKNVVKMHEGEVKIVSSKNPTIFEIKISSKLKEGG